MGKRLKVKGDMRERGKGKKGKGGNVDKPVLKTTNVFKKNLAI